MTADRSTIGPCRIRCQRFGLISCRYRSEERRYRGNHFAHFYIALFVPVAVEANAIVVHSEIKYLQYNLCILFFFFSSIFYCQKTICSTVPSRRAPVGHILSYVPEPNAKPGIVQFQTPADGIIGKLEKKNCQKQKKKKSHGSELE